MSSIFDAIVTLISNVDISQNKYSQCVGNILNVIIRKKRFELVNYLFSFAILKFDVMAIFRNEKLPSLKRGCFDGFLNINKNMTVHNVIWD